MKRILNLLVLLMAMTTGVTAAEDITLSVTSSSRYIVIPVSKAD